MANGGFASRIEGLSGASLLRRLLGAFCLEIRPGNLKSF